MQIVSARLRLFLPCVGNSGAEIDESMRLAMIAKVIGVEMLLDGKPGHELTVHSSTRLVMLM